MTRSRVANFHKTREPEGGRSQTKFAKRNRLFRYAAGRVRVGLDFLRVFVYNRSRKGSLHFPRHFPRRGTCLRRMREAHRTNSVTRSIPSMGRHVPSHKPSKSLASLANERPIHPRGDCLLTAVRLFARRATRIAARLNLRDWKPAFQAIDRSIDRFTPGRSWTASGSLLVPDAVIIKRIKAPSYPRATAISRTLLTVAR